MRRKEEQKDGQNAKYFSDYSFVYSCVSAKALATSENFSGYLVSFLKSSYIYGLWDRGMKIFRKFRLVRFIISLVTGIFAFVETGAIIVVSTAFAILILPVFIALYMIFFASAMLFSRRLNRKLRSELGEKDIFIYSLPRSAFGNEKSFLSGMIDELAEKDGCAVVLLSPYLLSPRGIFGSDRFFTAFRKEKKNVYFMRKYYFFSFKRRVASDNKRKVTFAA